MGGEVDGTLAPFFKEEDETKALTEAETNFRSLFLTSLYK